jgi:Zn-dependent protease
MQLTQKEIFRFIANAAAFIFLAFVLTASAIGVLVCTTSMTFSFKSLIVFPLSLSAVIISCAAYFPKWRHDWTKPFTD